jgi:hypothetical protein
MPIAEVDRRRTASKHRRQGQLGQVAGEVRRTYRDDIT